MSVHQVWDCAKESLGVSGGTIHQIARDYLGYTDLSYLSDLFLDKDDTCYVLLSGKYVSATFQEFTGIRKDKDGKWWLSARVFVPGFNSGGNLSGLKVGMTLKAKLPQF